MKTNQQGLTLIEVLIGVTLFAFMALSLLQVTDSNINTKEKVTKEDNQISAIDRAKLRLDWDLSHIYTPQYFSFKGDKSDPTSGDNFDNGRGRFLATTFDNFLIPKFDNPNKNTFQFFSFGNQRKSADIVESNFAWIVYTLRPSEKKIEANAGLSLFELVRYSIIRDLYNNDKIDLDKERAQVLLDNVLSLQFSFWSNKKEKFIEALTELDREEGETIRAIQVNLEWLDETGNKNNEKFIVRAIYPLYSRPKENEMLKRPMNGTGGNPNQNIKPPNSLSPSTPPASGGDSNDN